MDGSMYPTGNDRVNPRQAVAGPALTDVLSLIRGRDDKNITLENLLGNLKGLGLDPQIITQDGAIGAEKNLIIINSATPATKLSITGPAPSAGKLLIIGNISSGTVGADVTLSTAKYFDGDHQKATFDAKGELLAVIGASDNEYMVLSNVNTVTLATP